MSNQYPPPNQPYGTPYGAPPPPPGAAPGGAGKSSMGMDENLAAMLCYLSMFCCGVGIIVSLVFFLMEKTSRLVRFHAMQALVFGGIWIVVGILFRILYAVLSLANVGVLGLGLFGIQMIVILALVVMLVLAAIKAYQGQFYKLPVIGDLAENFTNKANF
jgi:uncharacterized membrane protein